MNRNGGDIKPFGRRLVKTLAAICRYYLRWICSGAVLLFFPDVVINEDDSIIVAGGAAGAVIGV